MAQLQWCVRRVTLVQLAVLRVAVSLAPRSCGRRRRGGAGRCGRRPWRRRGRAPPSRARGRTGRAASNTSPRRPWPRRPARCGGRGRGARSCGPTAARRTCLSRATCGWSACRHPPHGPPRTRSGPTRRPPRASAAREASAVRWDVGTGEGSSRRESSRLTARGALPLVTSGVSTTCWHSTASLLCPVGAGLVSPIAGITSRAAFDRNYSVEPQKAAHWQ